MAVTGVTNVTQAVTQLYGTQGSRSTPLLFVNLDSSNTVYLSNQSTVMAGGTNALPLAPGASVSFNGSTSVWAVTAGPTIQVAVLPGGTQYFLPASLSNLGGIKVFIQDTEPTGQIPVNSIWLQTADGIVIGFQTYDGTNWDPQQFNASEVIAVGTIVANLIATGTIIAGIVDGTTIQGAQIVADGDNGEFLVYSGTPAVANLVASISASGGQDAFGNIYPAGFMVGPLNGSQVFINPSDPNFDGAGSTTFQSGAADEGSPLTVVSQPVSSGVSPFIQASVVGPTNANDPDDTGFSVILNSASDDASAGGNPTTDATLAVADSFGNGYLIFSNLGDGSQTPTMGIGQPVPGTSPPMSLSPAFIQGAINGCLAAYGSFSGGTITRTFTANGTFTVPAGVTTVNVHARGPGAGGQWASGPGGGGGEYAAEPSMTVTPGTVLTVTIGQGGNGGNAAHGGGLGGSGATTVTGGPVSVIAHAAPANGSNPSTGGSGSSNTVHHNGGGTTAGSTGASQGGSGGAAAGNASGTGASGGKNSGRQPGGGGSGTGGSGAGGGGGWGQTTTGGSTTGSAGGIPGGGGGSGGATSTTGSNGGNGARGQVSITYTIPTSTTISMSLASQAGSDLNGKTYPAGYMGPVTAVDPVNGGPETWHSLGSAANGSATINVTNARYRMLSDGNVQIDISSAFTAGSGTQVAGTYQFANTLPAAYRPVFEQAYIYFMTTGTAAAGRFIVNNNGTVQIGAYTAPVVGDIINTSPIIYPTN